MYIYNYIYKQPWVATRISQKRALLRTFQSRLSKTMHGSPYEDKNIDERHVLVVVCHWTTQNWLLPEFMFWFIYPKFWLMSTYMTYHVSSYYAKHIAPSKKKDQGYHSLLAAYFSAGSSSSMCPYLFNWAGTDLVADNHHLGKPPKGLTLLVRYPHSRCFYVCITIDDRNILHRAMSYIVA